MKRVVYSSQESDSEDRKRALEPGYQTFPLRGYPGKIAVRVGEDESVQITEIKPYDDAEYTWVKWQADSPYCSFYRSGELQKTMRIREYDPEWFEDYGEYVRDAIERMALQMKELNEDVEPRIGYD